MASIVTSFVYAASIGKIASWITFSTSINHILVTLYALSCFHMLFAAFVRIHKRTEDPSESPQDGQINLSWIMKLHWLLFNAAANVSSFVVLGYWLFLFSTKKSFGNAVVIYTTIDRHGLNLLLLLVDFFLSCTPVRLLHFVYPSAVLACYFIYNCIYWASTGTLVYGEMLDYGKNTGKAVAMVIVAVFIVPPLAQLAWFMLFLLRNKLAAKKETELHPPYELTDHSSSA